MRECWPWGIKLRNSDKMMRLRFLRGLYYLTSKSFTIPELLEQADMVRMARRYRFNWSLMGNLENPGVAGM
jgi:hypothetical protein